MSLSYPAYYKAFTCLAANCPDSCCALWEVDVDAQTADMYRALPGDLGDRLRQVLTDDNTMVLENGRCPMWRQDGLCRIQAERGHDALCKTCREFPRLRHDYGDFTELMLELSCPEAARLIFSSPDEIITEEYPGEQPDYDTDLMVVLKTSREKVLEFIRNTDRPLGQVLAATLLYAHGVQNIIDGGEPEEISPEACLPLAQKYAATGDFKSLAAFFSQLEILTPQWRTLLETATFQRVNNDLRPLAVYLIRRYWLQAVSDYDLICRVKLILAACLLVAAVDGTPERAQLFSKEIENDPDNIEAILDAAYTHPAFTDLNLLRLLYN